MARRVVQLFQVTLAPSGGSHVDISDYVTNVTLDPATNILNTKTGAATSDLADRGFTAYKIQLEGHYDDAGVVSTLFDSIDVNGYADFVYLQTKGSAEGADNRKWTGTVAWPGSKEGGTPGDYEKFSLDLQSSAGTFTLDVTP